MVATRTLRTSDYPKPPESQITEAAKKLPDALHHFADTPPNGGHYAASTIEFVDCLVDAGETEAHAVHALRWLIDRQLLTECEDSRFLTTTPALWDWWRSGTQVELNETIRRADREQRGSMTGDVHESAVTEPTNGEEVEKTRTADDIRDHLSVDIAKQEAQLDGEHIDLRGERAARMISALLQKPGEWFGKQDWPDADPELDGFEPHRLKNSLPRPIAKLIKSKRGTGTRIVSRI